MQLKLVPFGADAAVVDVSARPACPVRAAVHCRAATAEYHWTHVLGQLRATGDSARSCSHDWRTP